MLPRQFGRFFPVAAFSAALFAFVGGLVFLPAAPSAAQEPDPEKRASLERQLEALEEEAAEIDGYLKSTQSEARTLEATINGFNAEIRQREIAIRRTNLAIQKADLDIKQKIGGIADLSEKIERSRRALGAGLFLLYTFEQENLLTILLKKRSLSGFFEAVDSVDRVGARLQENLADFKSDRITLENEKTDLEAYQREQQELKALHEVERRLLAQKKKEKDDLLRLTKGKEAIFQQMLQSKNRDIASLRTQLFYLEKTGITAEEALRLADLAAKRTGIRTAFLLAVLEVETGRRFEGGVISVGTNLGSGNWQADMSPSQHSAFFAITSELGFDPDQMPVSARPCSLAERNRIGPGKPCGYGWGGAMGPAQFIPTTWLLFKNKVAELTGHNPPNPWNAEDAFTAAAIFLADSGARSQNAAGETRAAKTYLSGRPTCSTASCNSYARNVLSTAQSIASIL